ncbi:cadherin-like protein 26 [Chanos chanos]|uniref:Cadherin-like protein 26 n=1 Tax=Chanos chanos TaxID=29144 RepID=A0A6J2VR78_CHACN|nr:cadherin-like protein 26 [Chanos chanos]
MNTTISSYIILLGLVCMCRMEEHVVRSKRAWIIDSFSIVEEHPGPFPYALGHINIERKYRVGFDLYGHGVDEDPKGILSIDKDTGVLTVHGKINYEEYTSLMLTFEVRNKSNLALDTKLGVNIEILDINDNPPLFQRNIYESTVSEQAMQGSFTLTVFAIDGDRPGTPNSTFDYRIISVTPNTPSAEWFIRDTGAILFKGCLDYEAAERYTIVVEAKDHGEGVQLSSSTTVLINVLDGNNHLPVITGHTGSGRVKERETGVSPLRIHVSDRDSYQTGAWRAKYTILGDVGQHFSIDTDPETNDGILTVIKPLDFEEGAERKVSVSVENVEPHFSCEVKEKTASEMWRVVTTGDEQKNSNEMDLSTVEFSIIVEDINDPPVFTVPVKEVLVKENVEIGFYVETVTAADQDLGFANEFVYAIGHDPGDWVRVDAKTGQIFTTCVLDRESIHVVNDTYTVILHATDKGDPPMTGTGTLLIRLHDQNDNVPQLVTNSVYICMMDEASVTEVAASDLDGFPYSDPFNFEILGDVEGKWRFEPNYGTTVHLVKENVVHSGLYTLLVKVSDRQGQFALQNLSVTVCDCSATPNCLFRKTTGGMGAAAIVTVLLAMLLFLGCLLLSLTASCRPEKVSIDTDCTSGDTLLKSNTETPGNDCSRIHTIEAPGMEVFDYDPHPYAFEGDFEGDSNPDLDSISIPDDDFSYDQLLDLGPRFNQLGVICKA